MPEPGGAGSHANPEDCALTLTTLWHREMTTLRETASIFPRYKIQITFSKNDTQSNFVFEQSTRRLQQICAPGLRLRRRAATVLSLRWPLAPPRESSEQGSQT